MDIRLLRSFIILAEQLNFTEASKRLFISQSTLSHQITELEREMEAPLLFRDKRSVSLTPSGAIFLQAARDIVLRFEQAQEQVRLEECGRSARLRVGFYGSPFYEFIPDAVRSFCGGRPDVDLELESLRPGELAEGLASGALDAIFSTSWLPGQGLISGTEKITLGTDRFVAVVPRGHPLAEKQGIRLSELRDEHLVLLGRGRDPTYYDAVVSLCRDAGFFPIITNQVSEPRELFIYIEAGLCVTVTMELPAAAYAGRVKILPLIDGPDAGAKTLLVWKKENKNPALAPFLEVCAEKARLRGMTD